MNESNVSRRNCCCGRYKKYDASFLAVYVFQYFNGGLKILLLIATQDMWKNYYLLEPTRAQLYSTIIWMPWAAKFIFGIISDTVPLFDSRRRNWLVFMGLLQFVALLVTSTTRNPLIAMVSLCVNMAAGAWMDVIVDAIMVMQARREPETGSQKL